MNWSTCIKDGIGISNSKILDFKEFAFTCFGPELLYHDQAMPIEKVFYSAAAKPQRGEIRPFEIYFAQPR